MNNPDDKATPLDDDLYDDVLEDNFDDGFDDDFSDLDLDVALDDDEFPQDYTQTAGDDGSTGESDLDDFDGFDNEWADEDIADSEFAAAGAQKEKRSFNMSFNAMAITGALILGLIVFGYQVMTKKPQGLIDRFTSALNMQGASDGPIFGEEEIKTTQLDLNAASGNTEEGFLYDPESLDKLQADLKDTPPMPSPVSAEAMSETQVPNIEDILTPLPKASSETIDPNTVPRSPEEVEIINIPENQLTQKVDNALEDLISGDSQQLAEISEPEVSETPPAPEIKVNKAEELLKSVMKNREDDDSKVLDTVQEDPVVKTSEAIALSDTIAITDTGAIEKKLDMIMSRLDDMEVQITQVREAGNVKIESISDNVTALKQELTQIAATPKAAASSPKKQTSSPKAQVSQTPQKVKSPTKAVSKSKSQPASWELRAAQPGKAWVSRKGQKDMQPVVVGEQLSGIGRITAISFDGKRWTVQGTSGRILQ